MLINFPTSATSPKMPQCKKRSECAPDRLFRGDGIRTHGGIAPTQPFQDCTLNLSDTPLYFLGGGIVSKQFRLIIFIFFYFVNSSANGDSTTPFNVLFTFLKFFATASIFSPHSKFLFT